MEHIQTHSMATREGGSLTPQIPLDYNRSPSGQFIRLNAAYQLPFEEEPESQLVINTVEHISCLAYSPNGKKLVFSVLKDSDSSTSCLYNLSTQEKIAMLHGQPDYVNYVSFNPAGDRIAAVFEQSSNDNDKACLWDAVTGKILKTIDLQDYLVSGITYSCDGKVLASYSLNGTVRLWDADSGESISPPLEHDNDVRGVFFTTKGNQIISHTPSDLYIWDRTTFECQNKSKFLISKVHQIAISPNGEHLVALGAVGICIWNRRANEDGFNLDYSNMEIDAFQAAFSSDSKSILLTNVRVTNSESRKNGFFIYDLTFRVLIPVLNIDKFIYDFSLSPNYSVAFEYGTKICIAPIPQLLPVTLSVISPNGEIAACVFSEGTIWLASPNEFPVVRKKLGGTVGNVVHLAFTSDNTFLAGVDEKFLYIWELSTLELRGTASCEDLPPVTNLYFLEDQCTLVSSHENQSRTVWDTVGDFLKGLRVGGIVTPLPLN